MVRRSIRLMTMGYYDNNGQPVISYKERLHRVFQRRKRARRQTEGFSFTFDDDDVSDCNDVFCDHSSEASTSGHLPKRQRTNTNSSWGNVRQYLVYFFLSIFTLALLFSGITVWKQMQTQLEAQQSVIQNMKMQMNMQLEAQQSVIQNMKMQMNMQLEAQQSVLQNNVMKMKMQLRVEQRDKEMMLMQLKQAQGELHHLSNRVCPLVDRMPNFALEQQGASVIERLSSETYSFQPPRLAFFMSFFWLPLRFIQKPHRTVIQAHCLPLTPGECWAFAGDRGHLFISLSHPATITKVTLGHIRMAQDPLDSINSAPRMFSVHGMTSVDGDITNLGTFKYDRNGESIQTFEVLGHRDRVFKFVKLKIESNWGEPDYTCVYNFRVHGKLSTSGV